MESLKKNLIRALFTIDSEEVEKVEKADQERDLWKRVRKKRNFSLEIHLIQEINHQPQLTTITKTLTLILIQSLRVGRIRLILVTIMIQE